MRCLQEGTFLRHPEQQKPGAWVSIVSSSKFWKGFSDLFRSFQIFSDLFRSFQIFSDLFRSFQIFSDLFRSFQIFSDLFRSFQYCLLGILIIGIMGPSTVLLYGPALRSCEAARFSSRFSRLWIWRKHTACISKVCCHIHGARAELMTSTFNYLHYLQFATALHSLSCTETRQLKGLWKLWKLWKQKVQRNSNHSQSLVMLPGDAKADTARSRPRTLSKLRSDVWLRTKCLNA